MAEYLKSNFVGSHVVSAAAVQYLHKAGNNRGQHLFNALAEFGATTSVPPLSQAQQAQTYTFTNVAAVDKFLNKPGVAIRGSEFLNALLIVGVPADYTIDVPGPATTVSFSLEGVWPIGTTIEVDLTAGELQLPEVYEYTCIDNTGPVPVAEALVTRFNFNPELSATQDGGNPVVITLTSAFNITITGITITEPTVLTPTLQSVNPNVYEVLNEWPAGQTVQVTLSVTDSQGDTDTNVFQVVTPPPGPWDPVTVASVLATQIDQLPFVNAMAVGAVITLSASEPGTTLVSSAVLV